MPCVLMKPALISYTLHNGLPVVMIHPLPACSRAQISRQRKARK